MREKFPSPESEKQGIQKLVTFIESISEISRAEGIPIDNNGRINMAAYADIYPDVEKDLKRSRELEQKWFATADETAIQEQRLQSDGEKLEILAHAIFTKYLGAEFIVARSSPHDDYVNKVDTIILNRTTGELVCAFDEVGSTSGFEYEQKQKVVQNRNLQGGASLKYGIKVESENDQKIIMATEANHIPLFYIALPKDRIEKGIKEFAPSMDQRSDFEEKLFSYFIATLLAQIEGLRLYNSKLNNELKTHLDTFKKTVDNLSSKLVKK